MIQTNKMIIAHHQVCYYNAGAMFDIVDPGAENKAEEGVVDEVLRFYINNTLSATWLDLSKNVLHVPSN